MDPDKLIRKLENWRRWQFIGFWAALMLLLMAILQTRIAHIHKSEVFEWYIAWALLELLVTPPGLCLLLAWPWKDLPLRDRMYVAYGYLASSWLGWFAFGVQTGSDPYYWSTNLDLWLFTILIIAAYGILIVFTHWLLRRAENNKSEEIFP